MAARFTIQYDIKLTQKRLGLASSIDIHGSLPCPDGTHKAIEENRLGAVSLAINRANSLLTCGWDDYEPWPSNNCVGIWMHETSPDPSVGPLEAKRIAGICKHSHYEVRMDGNRLELVSTQSLSRPPANGQRILEQIGLAAEVSAGTEASEEFTPLRPLIEEVLEEVTDPAPAPGLIASVCDRGFYSIKNVPGVGVISESSVIKDYHDAEENPGSSALWWGAAGQKSREDVEHMLGSGTVPQCVAGYIREWLEYGSLLFGCRPSHSLLNTEWPLFDKAEEAARIRKAPTTPAPGLEIRRSTPPLSSGLLLLCVMALGLLTGCDSPKDYSGPDEALHVAQGHTLGGAL
ncbi:hypothetical protein [Armatimonas sp.]|uniref:hypothetical protein n=1 Tax=Armatimonas sp. TaxID=1872638 RepID=UPI00286BCE76|nr:hypothetical protein [Armatimonas sp.]